MNIGKSMTAAGIIVAAFLSACSGFVAPPSQAKAEPETGAETGAEASAETGKTMASGTLIVGNKGEDTVSFIDLVTGREIRRIDTGPMPHEVAISPDKPLAAVVAYGGETLDIFDIRDGDRVQRIDLFPNTRPHGITWLKDGRIMVTTEGSDTLTIISHAMWCPPEDDACNMQETRITAISTGNEGSHMLAVNAAGDRAYVSNLQSKNITVINVATGEAMLDLDAGTEPEGIALTPSGKELWVAARGSDEVFVFDTETLEQIANIKTGRFPIRIAISPDGAHAVTSDLADGAISVIDTQSKQLVRSITVSGEREAAQVTLVFSPDGKQLYLAETGRSTVAEVDFASGRVLRRFSVGKDGDGLGISAVTTSQ